MHYQLRYPDNSVSVWQPQKIVCVAKNYAAHAAEMDSSVPGAPTFFIKPNSSLCDLGQAMHIPQNRGAVHHEIELGLVIGKRLSRADRIPEDAIAGYVLALDLTLRDLQSQLRGKGHPWEASKAFARACPVSPLLDQADVPDPGQAELGISVNGEVRQSGNTRDMVYKIPRLLADAAEIFVLEPGDLLLTGTPVGVGPLCAGDRFEAGSTSSVSMAASQMPESRCRGRVLEYDASRGYGRIVDEQDNQFFVHYRDIIDGLSLHKSQSVSFVAHWHRKGNIAQEVEVI